jgi:hypothetical protein
MSEVKKVEKVKETIMPKEFFLVCWKEFVAGKMLDKSEIVSELQIDIAQQKMKEYNGQKRLTTTDYRSFNLTKLLENKSLEIKETVKRELTDDELENLGV